METPNVRTFFNKLVSGPPKRRGSWSPADAKFWNRRCPSSVPSGSYVYTFDSDGAITELQHTSTSQLKTSSKSGSACKIPEFQTTSFSQLPYSKTGSLESVELDDDDLAAGNSFEFPHHSSGSCGSSPSSGFDSENSRFLIAGSGQLDHEFARSFGYEALDDIELYSQLEKILNPKADVEAADRRGVSRNITRFGEGYEDTCKFPLVLSCFTNISLLNPPVAGSGTYVSWDFLKMLGDAELCRQELETLRNLSFRFRCAPVCGRPIDNICPDPNAYLRNLCYQLVVENDFRSIAAREKNRALKRWNSIDDLVSFGNLSKLEKEFIGAKKAAKSSAFSDEILAFQKPEVFKNLSQTKLKQEKRNSLKRTASSRSLSNRQAFQELKAALATSPAAFARYITAFHLEQFQKGFDVHAFAQLVLYKNVGSLNTEHANRKLRQTLLNLLSFDDTIIAVLSQHFRSQLNAKPYSQAKAISEVIEAACSLRKLENFHGLNVVVGGLQSLPVYQMIDGWLFLECNLNAHYRDYCRLSKFARKLDHFVLGTTRPHIPTLGGLVNRLRLCCMVSWDLADADRKFVEHPSIAGWLHTEAMMGVVIGRLGSSSPKRSEVDVYETHYPRNAELTFNPLTESFLTHLPPVCLMTWSQFPTNWIGRYVPAMPEHVVRQILNSGQFRQMFEHFFEAPLSKYTLAPLK